MSLPSLNLQKSFFDTEVLLKRLFEAAPSDRFEFFHKTVLPELIGLRPKLESMYCADNGRPAEEPVRLLGVLILQFMERLPDRQAAEACTYDLRWKLALGMEADETAFHATSLVKFRNRLLAHGLENVGFDAVLQALRKAGYLRERKAQRLDSTHVIGLVSHMSRLECVRESVRLVLEELSDEKTLSRPESWPLWWERYVESTPDFKADVETLKQKMIQSGHDAGAILKWIASLPKRFQGLKNVGVLRQVFEENFQEESHGLEQRRAQPAGAIHNPHDPDAQWSAKKTILGKNKEWIGYKVQVAETLPTSAGPTDSVITAIMTQPAISSDKAALPEVEQQWTLQGLDTPKELYVDGGYTSAELLAQAHHQGRVLNGPVQPAPQKDQRFTAEDFLVRIEKRQAECPAKQFSSHASRLDEKRGKVNYRFEWTNRLCAACPLRSRCLGSGQKHRTLLVSQHHEHLQQRREEMRTEEFRQKMHRRNAIEGSISELKRAHGMARSRYRGLAKNRLQSYLIGAACNIKRWARRLTWEALHPNLVPA